MSMYLKYGSYSFPTDGVTIKTRTDPVLNAAGMPMTLITKAFVSGDLICTLPTATEAQAQADLTSKETELRTALAIPYRDLIFYQGNGSESAVFLKNAGTLSGVVITAGPHFEGDRGTGEYSTKRSFTFEASVEFLYPDRRSALMSFSESLKFEGGGPLYIYSRSVDQPPQRQLAWRHTEYRCVQSGEAVGLTTWPPAAAPKFPQWLKEAPQISEEDPKRVGPTAYKNFKTTWSYTFESHRPLVAHPTLWIS